MTALRLATLAGLAVLLAGLYAWRAHRRADREAPAPPPAPSATAPAPAPSAPAAAPLPRILDFGRDT